jgi:hypothetical protein
LKEKCSSCDLIPLRLNTKYRIYSLKITEPPNTETVVSRNTIYRKARGMVVSTKLVWVCTPNVLFFLLKYPSNPINLLFSSTIIVWIWILLKLQQQLVNNLCSHATSCKVITEATVVVQNPWLPISVIHQPLKQQNVSNNIIMYVGRHTIIKLSQLEKHIRKIHLSIWDLENMTPKGFSKTSMPNSKYIL